MDWFSYEAGKRDARVEDSGENFAAAFKAAACVPFVAIFCALFPLTSLLTAAAWYGSDLAGRSLADQLTGFNALLASLILPLIVASAVLAGCMWGESRLAAYRGYWWFRHVLRVVLLSVAAFVAHFRLQNSRWPGNWADVQQSIEGGG